MVDLLLTAFCAVTVLVLVFAECGSTSKEEELLDTLLLVARNVLQFARLAAVMRKYVKSCTEVPLIDSLCCYRSGQSIFTRPKPIDLTLPHRSGPGGGYSLDIDLEEDEDEVRHLGARNQLVFDAERDRRLQLQQQQRRALAVRPVDTGDQTDTWASLG